MARIFKIGKSYYIDYRYKGKRVRKVIGRSKRVAKRYLKKIEFKIAEGELFGIEKKRKVRFKDFAKEYLTHSKANKAASSYRRDVLSLKGHLIPHFGKKWLHELTTYEIERYRTERLSKVKPATVNREIACLRHLYNVAIRWGIVAKNPTQGIRSLKENPRTRFLSREEIEALLVECKGIIYSVVLTAIYTGMRLGELLNLKWTDINFSIRNIKVYASKTNSYRSIPIAPPLYEELMNLPRYSEYVFAHKNGKPYKDLRKSFKDALKKAGIKDCTFHTLRHTYASHLVMAGVDLRTVQELMGHKTIQMTMRYAHLSPDRLEIAMHKYDRRLSRLEGHSVDDKHKLPPVEIHLSDKS